MKAIIEVDVPEFQIGEEVTVYFKDTMSVKGNVQASHSSLDVDKAAYRLIRKEARRFDRPDNDPALAAYVRGVVDLQTELFDARVSPNTCK